MTSRRDCANAIRFLAMDAVQKANSGHPGMPMGMADMAEALWRGALRYNPANPNWSNRDRFVVSNGHGAMLHYALLHLSGFDLTIDDLKAFRQFHSKTPGHPEYGETPGVETTTGPLGQGLANGVGMAMAEQMLAAHFNRDGFSIVDHHTYVFVGDGCLMEGVSHEACSLAGTLGLGKLIVLWDDNGISIDGDVTGWFTDDTPKRFEAYNWHVIRDVDGHDGGAVQKAIDVARGQTDKPTLICCKTQIGYGSPNLAGSSAAHGAPLGEAEIERVREQLNWPHPAFHIPEALYNAWNARALGEKQENDWNQSFAEYETAYPELASEFLRRDQGHLPDNWPDMSAKWIEQVQAMAKDVATRKSSLLSLNHFAPLLPELLGGSADLSGSNCTLWAGAEVLSQANPNGNYIEYGVREFGMSAIMNGLALHGGFIPYGGTFLTFSDYARNALRLSALMKQRVIYVYTHDSIGLGEDGPTHQPVEHAAMLRMTPECHVWRPCDAVETAVAWKHAIEYQGPSALLLTRQTVPHMSRDAATCANVAKGAYILFEPEGAVLDAILLSTGSEVQLAMMAAKALKEQSIHVRVVSMPCCDVFKMQDASYQEAVLPAEVTKRMAIEAGVSDYWHQFVGREAAGGKVLGLDHFGASAPDQDLFEAYGFTVEHVVSSLKALLGN